MKCPKCGLEWDFRKDIDKLNKIAKKNKGKIIDKHEFNRLFGYAPTSDPDWSTPVRSGMVKKAGRIHKGKGER